MNMVRVAIEGAPGPGEFKIRLKALIHSLKKTKIALTKLHKSTQYLVFRGLPEAVGPVDEARFVDDLCRLIETCEFLIESVKTPPGSRRWSAAKHVCALQASILLKEFSPSRLSQAKKGHFFNLASLSGEEEKDLTAYCEDLDRVEPLYVAKIPNVLGL